MSKFAEVIQSLNITEQELVLASCAAEKRTAEQSRHAFVRHQTKKAGKKTEEANLPKPPTGRALTRKSIVDALAGNPQSRIVRGKLVRAVNILAKHKKKAAPMTAIDLFGETKRKVGKKKD